MIEGRSCFAENERRMLQEIDGLFQVSPIGHKKPIPFEEADTRLADTTPFVFRYIAALITALGENAGCVYCPSTIFPSR